MYPYCNGIPVSVLLSCPQACLGNCETFSMLFTLGLGKSNFNLVYATINDLSLNPNNQGSNCIHCFIEFNDTNNNQWVYDISTGLKYDKKLYYLIEEPVIYKVHNRDTIKEDELYNILINDKLELGYSIEDIINLPIKSNELVEEINAYKENMNKKLS